MSWNFHDHIICYQSLPMQVIWTDPSDAGFGCVSRRRSFTIFVRRDRGRWVSDPQHLYDKFARRLAAKQVTIPGLIWATQQAVTSEIKQLTENASARNPPNLHKKMEDCLTETEAKNQKKYRKILEDKDFPRELFAYAPGQDPKHCSKTALHGVLPLFTATDRILWMEGPNRPLLAIEKLAAHGYPVRHDLAKALSTPASHLHRLLRRSYVFC